MWPGIDIGGVPATRINTHKNIQNGDHEPAGTLVKGTIRDIHNQINPYHFPGNQPWTLVVLYIVWLASPLILSALDVQHTKEGSGNFGPLLCI